MHLWLDDPGVAPKGAGWSFFLAPTLSRLEQNGLVTSVDRGESLMSGSAGAFYMVGLFFEALARNGWDGFMRSVKRSLGLDERVRPFRLLLTHPPSGDGRRADATAKAEGASGPHW